MPDPTDPAENHMSQDYDSVNELDHLQRTVAAFAPASETEAYAAGYRSATKGPDTENCSPQFFRSPKLTREWERGHGAGKEAMGHED